INEWKTEDETEEKKSESFYYRFVQQFAPEERQHRWAIELGALKQQELEKLDTYANKFKRLLSQVNLGHSLPDIHIVRMFFKGLKGRNATFVSVAAPKNLNEAIAAARRVEAGEYYSEPTVRSNSISHNVGNEWNEMKKRIEGLALNYATLKRNGGLKCGKCGEVGHVARRCMSEKVNYSYQRKEKNNSNQTKTISFCELETENSGEVYIVKNEPTPKNIVKRPANPKWEERLRKTIRNQPELPKNQQIVDVDNAPSITDPPPISKPKGRRGPSKIDSLKPYNVADDILSLPTNVTVGQILQYPNQRRNLAKILKRPPIPKNLNFLKEPQRTTAVRCYIRIQNNPVLAVLDSGAAVSIITTQLLYKLGLKVDNNFTTTIIMATGARAKTLGKVKDVKIILNDMYAGKSTEVPISNTGFEGLDPPNEDSHSDGTDTFDEFDYEDEEFDNNAEEKLGS
ncbi:1639_t:CDS:2, partial [Ambispora leptoticha]